MLYLRKFFNLVKYDPFWSISFVGGFFLLSLALGQYSWLESQMSTTRTVTTPSPFFHALIDKNQNVSRIVRKLQELPGVFSVVALDSDDMKKTLNEIVEQMDESLASVLSDFPFEGIKIVLKNELGIKSEKLIRGYIGRLAGGAENVSFGMTVREKNKNKELSGGGSLINSLFENKQIITIFFIFVLWAFSTLIFCRRQKQWMYCVERFQRKSNFYLKVPLSALSLATIISFSVQYLIIGNVNYLFFSLTLLCFVLTWLMAQDMKKWE